MNSANGKTVTVKRAWSPQRCLAVAALAETVAVVINNQSSANELVAWIGNGDGVFRCFLMQVSNKK
jgi:hypothetical protein